MDTNENKMSFGSHNETYFIRKKVDYQGEICETPRFMSENK